MLFMEKTPKNAGISLWGDSSFLIELHQLTYKCWDSLFITNESLRETLYSFSYDIRKAFNGAREQDYVQDVSGKNIPIYGVKINWLLILIAISYMRHTMAYLETNKKDQSIIYLLEHHLEEILNEQFPKTASLIANLANQFVFENQKYLSSNFSTREIYFLNLTTKSKRTIELLPIMRSLLSLNVMSDEKTLAIINAISLTDNCYPKAIKW